MKKFWAFILVVLAALTMSACSAFHADSTQTYSQDNPLQMAVFLQVKDQTHFSTDQLAAWKADLERIIATPTTDPTAVKITAATFRETSNTALTGTYTVDLTLANVPDTTLQKTVRPFKIYYQQTVYNPIALLPPSDTFTYIVGYTTERRHSTVNTEWTEIQDDGTYVYLWTTGDAIQFTDVYPNRPLYYGLVLAGAVVIGVVVYLISRYNDCKKSQKSL